MPKGVPSLGPGAVSLSAAVHAAVVGGALLASVLAREPWPETAHAAAPPGPMVLDLTATHGTRAARRGFPRREGTRPPRMKQTRTGAGARRGFTPLQPNPIGTIDLGTDPPDFFGQDGPGNCTTGCVVASDASDGPAIGDPRGDGSGPSEPVTVFPGGKVRPPLKVRDVAPIYPEMAIRSRTEGDVEIECRIDTTGRVVDAKVLRGHQLLAPAALDAVRHWSYQPTLLNGVPVSVVMAVTVHFRLRD